MNETYIYPIRANYEHDGSFSGAIGYLVLFSGTREILPLKIADFYSLPGLEDAVPVSYARLLDEAAARKAPGS